MTTKKETGEYMNSPEYKKLLRDARADILEDTKTIHTAKPVIKDPPARWYEFDRLIPYRDLVLALGGAVLVYGAFRFSTGLACIVAGAGLIKLSLLMAKK